MNKKENDLLKLFSANLRRFRHKKKCTQIKVCIATDIDRSVYQKYESSNSPDIRLTNLYKLSEFFEKSLDDFIRPINDNKK